MIPHYKMNLIKNIITAGEKIQYYISTENHGGRLWAPAHITLI
jgi:hypothetical protein